MFCLQSALQVVDQHLQGDGLQLRTHSLAHGVQLVVQHIVDMPLDQLIASFETFIHSKRDIVLYNALPFNVLKGLAISLITMLSYKSLRPILKGRETT